MTVCLFVIGVVVLPSQFAKMFCCYVVVVDGVGAVALLSCYAFYVAVLLCCDVVVS